MSQPQYFPIGVNEKNVVIPVYIADLSTPDYGKTGLAFDDTNLDCFYSTNLSTAGTAITLATATKGTYTSGGFIEIDATADELDGWYEFGVPNTIITGPEVRWLLLSFEEDGGTALDMCETHVLCPILRRGYAWGR